MTSRPWLAPIGAAFGVAVQARARLYARGTLRRDALEGAVISVGNLAVGGRGKTPIVARIARLLQEAGRPVAILSRGYGGTAATPTLVSDGTSVVATAEVAGDEPVMLARALPGVIVAVARRRVDAGRLVEARFGPRAHVLDDGFQHLALRRDLDIVCVDADDLVARPLPAGPLREPAKALGRAHLVFLAGPRGASLPDALDPARTFRWRRRSLGFVSADGARRTAPARAFVLAAIAGPERLIADLAALGCAVVGSALYRDHHRFTRREIEAAAAAARDAGAEAVVTTGKDAVRLAWMEMPPLVIHRIEAVIDDESRLLAILLAAADKKKTP